MTTTELSNLELDLNAIYNQAGITVKVEDKGYKNFNFDVITDDNSLGPQEQQWLHWAFIRYMGPFGNVMQKSDNTTIWRVNDIPPTQGLEVNGRATRYGINSAAINVTNGTPTFRTIPHEIGHARYELRHPDEDWMNEEGMLGKVDTDRYNLMNSGPLFQSLTVGSLSDFKIRRYQWKKIQKNH